MGLVMRAEISVDVSAAVTTVNSIYKNLKAETFNKVLERTIKDAGNRGVKKLVKQAVTNEYAVSSGWVGDKIKRARFSGSGASVGCVVPISSVRGTLGGIFSASGGGYRSGRAKGSKLMQKTKRRKSTITAKILRGKASVLPGSLPNQGGYPPFRLPNGAVVTRTARKGGRAIARVVGRAVPQMVDRHFEDSIRDPLNDYILKRMSQLVKQEMGI